MIKKLFNKISFLLMLFTIILSSLLSVNKALCAEDDSDTGGTAIEQFTGGLDTSAIEAGITTEKPNTGTELTTLIGTIIGGLLYFAATILLILIIYGGYMWMTAGGNDQQIEKGQKYIKNAIIGYIVIAVSYLIVQLVTTQINY